MRILVITSCTGKKAIGCADALTFADFRKGRKHVARREKGLVEYLRPAREMYSGQQHLRLMRGVRATRGTRSSDGLAIAVDLWILSAGYGLVPGDRRIAPYECTFSGMRSKEFRRWTDTLGVPEAFRAVVAGAYDLGILLLGNQYLQACRLDANVQFGGMTVTICGPLAAQRLPASANLRTVVLTKSDARRFACAQVGLKGELAARLLEGVRDGKVGLIDLARPNFDLVRCLSDGEPPTSPVRFEHFTPRPNAKLLYFIPEWDDRVDPHYDFSADGITPGRNPYTHDVYAHEIYPTPNYDGVLVSKSVIEQNRAKKVRIQKIGIHAHVRVPRNFPVMGDCGAFNYIGAPEPPFETEETVCYYDALDFDFGVSIDHLIVPEVLQKDVYQLVQPNGRAKALTAEEFTVLKRRGMVVTKGKPTSRILFPNGPEIYTWTEPDLKEGQRRWEITLKNSEEFLRVHQKRGARFCPIAACQGWDVASQAEMFRLQQTMGYDFIALGGLVRSRTEDILAVLEAVNKVRKKTTRIHLFGVARPEAIQDFIRARVNSVDSARFLRQAWLSATSNYYSGDPASYARMLASGGAEGEEGPPVANNRWRFTALRIPPLFREGSRTLRKEARALVEQGHGIEELMDLERRALEAVHAFDREEVGLEKTLAAVIAYDRLLGGDARNGPLYRRLLQEKPWKACPCAVCRQTGIDVVIFRRNNRNRRRGFHNTWWFFQFFQHVINGTSSPR